MPPEEPNGRLLSLVNAAVYVSLLHGCLGVIISYELWMRGLPNSQGVRTPALRRIFYTLGQYDPIKEYEMDPAALEPPATNYTQNFLEPFTQYQFQVLSENSLGKAASNWVTGRTLEDGN
jgi:usherin